MNTGNSQRASMPGGSTYPGGIGAEDHRQHRHDPAGSSEISAAGVVGIVTQAQNDDRATHSIGRDVPVEVHA